jgi:hypothetical protein
LEVAAVFAPASDEDGGHQLCADRLPRPWSSRIKPDEDRTWSGLGHANPALTRIVADCAPEWPSAPVRSRCRPVCSTATETSIASGDCVMIDT